MKWTKELNITYTLVGQKIMETNVFKQEMRSLFSPVMNAGIYKEVGMFGILADMTPANRENLLQQLNEKWNVTAQGVETIDQALIMYDKLINEIDFRFRSGRGIKICGEEWELQD